MRYTVLLYLFFQCFAFGQKELSINDGNYVLSKPFLFNLKNWKPFSGISVSEDEYTICYAKVENGMTTYCEVYDHKNKLLYKEFATEFETRQDTIDKKPVLKPQNPKVDIKNLKIAYMQLTYNKEGNLKPVRTNGIIKTDDRKFFYENGILTKVEKYYDEDFKKIAERILVFHTALGNMGYESETFIEYESQFEKWNKDGSFKSKGIYKNNEWND